MVESHPLTPFLPVSGRVLFLGSFPPPRQRWSMEFFYPNWINDFWRIMGLVFYDDKGRFEMKGEKRFDKEAIVQFACDQGLGFFDTASVVNRLKDNASDNFLEIVEPTDVAMLLKAMPECRCLVTTGGKASEELARQLSDNASDEVKVPPVGECISCRAWGRDLTWWRMPSSSRAYPLALPKKAAAYARIFASM